MSVTLNNGLSWTDAEIEDAGSELLGLVRETYPSDIEGGLANAAMAIAECMFPWSANRPPHSQVICLADAIYAAALDEFNETKGDES